LAGEPRAVLPTHELHKIMVEGKNQMRKTHLFQGSDTLPPVLKTGEASGLRHRRPVQYGQALSHKHKQNPKQDITLVSVGASIINRSFVRHSAMYEVSL
jgi:hypothetical protein